MIMGTKPIRLTMVIPVYDDWTSLNRLLRAIDDQPGLDCVEFGVLVVNDGSSTSPSINPWDECGFRRIHSMKLINLICNLGNQRAVAVGLVSAIKEPDVDGVIIMDADGEDRPEDVPRLIAAAVSNPGKIICAQRMKRSEPFGFRAFYLLYKAMFRILAGASINFGNFCYIPAPALYNLAYSPSLWNNLAATLMRSRLPLARIATERGSRYGGASTMDVNALVAHGLSAISVYSDMVLVRIMMGMLGISVATVMGLVGVAAIRLFSDLAIPGWASSVFGSLSIVLLQSLIFAIISAFLLLSARSVKPVIPMIDAPQFVASTEHLGVPFLKDAIAS